MRASLHRTEIGLVERGERSVLLETAIKLAGAAEFPLADLIAGVDGRRASPSAGSSRRREGSEG